MEESAVFNSAYLFLDLSTSTVDSKFFQFQNSKSGT